MGSTMRDLCEHIRHVFISQMFIVKAMPGIADLTVPTVQRLASMK